MKDFVDYQDLCYGLKKVFAEDFNKNLLPQVSSDPNLKLDPENVKFAVGPFLNKFFGPNTKVPLLTELYPIYEPEELIDRVVNGISLEEAASLDKDITLNKFMGEYSVTSVPFYARTNKEIAGKIKDNLEKFSSGNFTQEDIEAFTVVNHLCDVMRADLTSMINGTDKAIDLSVNFNLGSYKAIMPFMSVDDPQIVKLFQDHELTPKEQENVVRLNSESPSLDVYKTPGDLRMAIYAENNNHEVNTFQDLADHAFCFVHEDYQDHPNSEENYLLDDVLEPLVDTMGLVDQIYQDQIDLGPYLPQPELTVKKHKSRGI